MKIILTATAISLLLAAPPEVAATRQLLRGTDSGGGGEPWQIYGDPMIAQQSDGGSGGLACPPIQKMTDDILTEIQRLEEDSENGLFDDEDFHERLANLGATDDCLDILEVGSRPLYLLKYSRQSAN